MSTSGQPPLDTALDILANSFRRRLLVGLLKDDPQVPLQPADVNVDHEIPGYWNVYVAHTHLPKLEDVGFIEWDQGTNEIRPGPDFDEIRPLLELFDDRADELPYEWP